MKNDAELQFHKLSITRQEKLVDGVFIIYTNRPFDFEAGQVCGIKLREENPYRLYSIASGENEGELAFLYNIYPGGLLTPRMMESCAGTDIWISEPTGSFLIPKGPGTLIATGTGIAPFISTLKSDKLDGKTIIHGARTKEHLYLQELFSNAIGSNYIPCCSQDSGPNIYAGRLTEYLKQQQNMPADHNFFLCGSPAMVVTVRELLLSKGVDFENILSEIYF